MFNDQFKKAVEAHVSTKPPTITFDVGWIGTNAAWFISAKRTIHGKAVWAFTYIHSDDPADAIEWIDHVSANILKPRSVPVVLADDKQAGQMLEELPHYWVTDTGFELLRRQ